ncbi:MAG TPA: patatin-like phospholipase family protein [Bacillota bacterium]
MAKKKLGLVLSGGGASGAYEAGVIHTLAKMGFNPKVISGASIGALNGVILASNRSMKKAAKNLEILWRGLDREQILCFRRNRGYKRPLSLASLQLLLSRVKGASLLETAKYNYGEAWETFSEENKEYFAVLDETPIESILKSAINFKKMSSWRELYVSVFPGSEGLLGAVKDIFHWMFSDRKSEFFRVNSLRPDEVITVLKASSALPLAYPGQEFQGQFYRDGGLGGSTGNTPIEPVVRAGCTHAIVVVLVDETQIDPASWPGLKMAVIKPSTPILRKGNLRATLDFSQERIARLLALGKEDAWYCRELWELKADLLAGRPFAKLADVILHGRNQLPKSDS